MSLDCLASNLISVSELVWFYIWIMWSGLNDSLMSIYWTFFEPLSLQINDLKENKNKTNKSRWSFRTKVMVLYKMQKRQPVSMGADVLQWLSCITARFSACHALVIILICVNAISNLWLIHIYQWVYTSTKKINENFVKLAGSFTSDWLMKTFTHKELDYLVDRSPNIDAVKYFSGPNWVTVKKKNTLATWKKLSIVLLWFIQLLAFL